MLLFELLDLVFRKLLLELLLLELLLELLLLELGSFKTFKTIADHSMVGGTYPPGFAPSSVVKVYSVYNRLILSPEAMCLMRIVNVMVTETMEAEREAYFSVLPASVAATYGAVQTTKSKSKPKAVFTLNQMYPPGVFTLKFLVPEDFPLMLRHIYLKSMATRAKVHIEAVKQFATSLDTRPVVRKQWRDTRSTLSNLGLLHPLQLEEGGHLIELPEVEASEPHTFSNSLLSSPLFVITTLIELGRFDEAILIATPESPMLSLSDEPQVVRGQEVRVVSPEDIVRKQNQNKCFEAYVAEMSSFTLNAMSFTDYFHSIKAQAILRASTHLILMDFPYKRSEEPTPEELHTLRMLIDYIAAPGAVVVATCNWLSVSRFADIFKPINKTGKPCRWRVDPKPFIIIRAPIRNRAPRRSSTMTPLSEMGFIAYNKVLQPGKKNSWILGHHTDTAVLYQKWPGPIFPYASNVYGNYMPPTGEQRLKNKQGLPWRTFAEKSIKFYCWGILKYTMPGQRVMDIFGGTGTSGIASHNFGRLFSSCEKNPELTRDAQLRFGKYLRLCADRNAKIAWDWSLASAARLASRPATETILRCNNVPAGCVEGSDVHDECKRQGSFLEVRKSELKGLDGKSVGLGLIAKKHYQPGEAIVGFWGEWIAPELVPKDDLWKPGFLRVKNPAAGGQLLKGDARDPAV
jgi:hypothetical protein